MDTTFRKIGEFYISNLCLETYPCKHYIKLKNGETKLMRGDDIYKLFHKNGIKDDHFDKYIEFIKNEKQRKIDFTESAKQIKKEMNEKQKQRDKEKAIIEQYKASSRIEKLKQQNNIKP